MGIGVSKETADPARTLWASCDEWSLVRVSSGCRRGMVCPVNDVADESRSVELCCPGRVWSERVYEVPPADRPSVTCISPSSREIENEILKRASAAKTIMIV